MPHVDSPETTTGSTFSKRISVPKTTATNKYTLQTKSMQTLSADEQEGTLLPTTKVAHTKMSEDGAFGSEIIDRNVLYPGLSAG